MRDPMSEEWLSEAMDNVEALDLELGFAVGLHTMRVYTGDSGGGPATAVLEVRDLTRTNPAFHCAVFVFVMDDRYQPVQPRYDSTSGSVRAFYPMSALAGVTHVLRTGSTCCYTQYKNGYARVQVRNA